jgi:hypothetical protein
VPLSLPVNPLGWLFCAAATISAVAHLSGEYAIYALLAQPDRLPAGEALAWLTSWVWILFIGCTVLLLLLFPDGHLPGSRWRWLGWLTLLLTSVGAVWQAFSPGVIVSLGSIRNPLGIEGLPKANEPVETIMFALLFLAVASSLSVRLRRARGIERQQIKWQPYTAVMAATGSVLAYTIAEAMGSRWLEWIGFVILMVALVTFPISVGIAIVRYRLYEIDLIINRTLVYGSLTITLVALYFGALRRRIQSLIDRSFYRSKYDAANTLQGFSMKLRSETDLGALTDDLVGVVRETMQPAHVFLWLHPDRSRNGERAE